MIRKKHYVIVKNIDGSPNKQRLKIWLRGNNGDSNRFLILNYGDTIFSHSQSAINIQTRFEPRFGKY